jgi:DNA recombination protein RmuC
VSVPLIAFLAFAAGLGVGLLVAFLLQARRARSSAEIAEQVQRKSEEQHRRDLEQILEGIKASFGALSLQTLDRATEQLLSQAKSLREVDARNLEEKKGLIDQQLGNVRRELEKVTTVIQDFERDRSQKFGELASRLRETSERTLHLTESANKLREALSSSKARGQWGERMAEDVLRLAGFVENVNYLKQRQIDGVGSRPDFTFLLPRDLRLNMDVKFPLDNFLRYQEAESEEERERYRSGFLKDVKARINEITTREYINPEQNTVDYVLLFIPSERIYGFIHEQDRDLMDMGLRNKVVFCSPLTLFAVLAVIRQAVDNFTLEKTSNEILSLLGRFRKEWENFVDKMDTLGKRIDSTRKEYENLTGVRRRQLERPLQRLEEIRATKGLPEEPPEKGRTALPGE